MPRKVFTAGEVLAAADVNEFLQDQAIMVFAGTAARGSAIPTPTEGMYTHLSDTDVLQYYNGSAWVSPIPTPTPAAILQVVSTSKTDVFTTSSSTYTTVTGLSATITPSSATSKILVMAQIAVGGQDANVSAGFFKVTRGGTDFYIGDSAGSRVRTVFGNYNAANMSTFMFSFPIIAQDSPASTAALTYRVETRTHDGSGGVRVNRSANDSDAAPQGRGASSITVMEIAG
jgi:hypothetical protein